MAAKQSTEVHSCARPTEAVGRPPHGAARQHSVVAAKRGGRQKPLRLWLSSANDVRLVLRHSPDARANVAK
jgi:hypothetical protein